MGKLRRKRLKVSRYSPINIGKKCSYSQEVDIKSIITDLSHSSEVIASNDDWSKVDVSESNKQNVRGGLKIALEKVRSSCSEEKLTGLNMLAAFALEFKSAEFIVQNGMVSSIAPLLCHENSQVRLAAAGALRNLCAWSSDSIISIIIQHDILQPLSQILKSYEFNNPTQKPILSRSNSKGIAHSMTESDPQNLIFNHAVNVLWSLCECSEEAIIYFNSENLIDILLRHIDPFVWGYETALASADCLFCVSENNPKAISSILPITQDLYSLLTKSLFANNGRDVRDLHFSIVITGILLNVNFWALGDATSNKILEVVSYVLDFDANSILIKGCSSPRPRVTVQELFDHAISAQLIAFEVLSNFCCPDGVLVCSFKDEDEWEECESIGEEDEENLSGGKMEVEESENKLTSLPSHLPIEAVERMKYFQLVEKIVEKVMRDIPCGIDGKSEEEEKDITEKLLQLRTRGLQCLQNVIGCSLQVDELGGEEFLHSLWLKFGQMFYNCSSAIDCDILDAISGVMRASVEKLSKIDCIHLSDITQNDLQMIFEAGSSCQRSLVRANFCRMVGFFGCSYVVKLESSQWSDDGHSSVLSQITEFLLKVGQQDSALWVRAEALDVLIDLFSDDITDALALSVRLGDKLNEILPQFKSKYNQEKKRLGDHRPLVLTVKENLPAFIRYKEQRISKVEKM